MAREPVEQASLAAHALATRLVREYWVSRVEVVFYREDPIPLIHAGGAGNTFTVEVRTANSRGIRKDPFKAMPTEMFPILKELITKYDAIRVAVLLYPTVRRPSKPYPIFHEIEDQGEVN